MIKDFLYKLKKIHIENSRDLFKTYFVLIKIVIKKILRMLGNNDVPAIVQNKTLDKVKTLIPHFNHSKINKSVTIIIPVFNAPDELTLCLNSLIKYTNSMTSLIIIDDCSTDPSISLILENYKNFKNITIKRNAVNMGFTKTINLGIQEAKQTDIILLNSDTIVTPRWIENLRLAAYSHDKIATVTPLSDNAGVFSVPEINKSNNLIEDSSTDQIARAITQNSEILYPVIPTGNGFCMYIRRDCLNNIGLFDDATFPRGYGEENDFCMRALRAGWINIIDDRTIIFHKRSASFGEEKHSLMITGRKILDERYPEYQQLIKKFFVGVDFIRIRNYIKELIADSEKIQATKPRYLFVISTLSGGTPQTNTDLMKDLRSDYDTWLLKYERHALVIEQVNEEGSIEKDRYILRNSIDLITHSSIEYDKVLFDWLYRYGIELIHIRHIGWHSLGLFSLCKDMEIPVIFSFHDFYTLCPNVKLLNSDNKYCGGICTETINTNECNIELWNKAECPPLRGRWISQWRKMMSDAVLQADAFITTSDMTKKIIRSVFNSIPHDQFSVIPHGRDFPAFLQLACTPEKDKHLRILVPGHINLAKGGEIIRYCINHEESKRLEFHIVGSNISQLTGPQIVNHGIYERKNFFNITKIIKPHIGVILSIWPETWCHTLTELWAAGIPVIALDLGIVGERIKKSGAGWLIPPENIESIIDVFKNITEDIADYKKKLNNVVLWQNNEGFINTISVMANRYRMVYRKVIEGRKAFK